MPGVFPTCSANSHSFPSSHSPLLGLVLVVGALVSLFALLAMRHQTPANSYLLAPFVSLPSSGLVV